jgi:hypothetical protein
MEFSNLTNEQIGYLEARLKEAYTEGYIDGWHNWSEDEDCLHIDMEKEFSESLAKNQSCHTLAARFMKPSDFTFDVKDLQSGDYVEPLSPQMMGVLFGSNK